MSDWPHIRLKYVADVRFSGVDKKSVDGQVPVRLCNYTDVYYSDRIVADMPFMEASATRDQVDAFTLRAGDALLTKDSETADDIGVSAFVPEDLPGILCGYHLAMVRPRPGAVDGRYLQWALSSTEARQQFEVAATGVTRFGLRQDAVAGMLLYVPPLSEQWAIADYLDAETARIDRMVQMLDRLRTLLEDRWNHVLDDEVLGRTRGREPDQGRESSGPFAAAVGRWPAGWTPQPLKRVLVANQSGVWGEDPTGSQDTVVLRSTDISINGAWTITDPATRSLSVLDLHAARLRLGDIVVVTSSGSEQHIGKAALVDDAVSELGAAFSNFTQRLSTSKLAEPRYVWYLLRSPFGREQLRWLSSTTTGLRNLSGRVLEAITFPGPPIGDQRRIVLALDEVRSDLDSIAGRLDRQIELLLERRQSLITAAVTGQVEIPGVAA